MKMISPVQTMHWQSLSLSCENGHLRARAPGSMCWRNDTSLVFSLLRHDQGTLAQICRRKTFERFSFGALVSQFEGRVS